MILFLRICEYSFKRINSEQSFQHYIILTSKVLQVLLNLDFNPQAPLINEKLNSEIVEQFC